MNLHEYQSKQLFAQYAIPVPKGQVVSSPDEAVAAAKHLGGSLWVVKAQVHAGGRGKAGGVKVAKDLDAVRVFSKAAAKSAKPQPKKVVKKAVKKIPKKTGKAAPRRPK